MKNLKKVDTTEEFYKKDKKKLVQKSKLVHEGYLFEQVWNPKRGSMFISLFDGKPKLLEQIGEVIPVNSSAIEKGVILLPDTFEDYGKIEDLVDMIKNHIHKYLDISEDMEIFSVYYILMSWLVDKTTTVNYLRFMGDWGSGKSRGLDVIGRICYKPILITGALTVAPVFRLLDLWEGTLIIDEGDFKKSDEQQDIMKILNAGFEKSRATVVRCNPNDPSIIDTFNVYGTKIISSRKSWYDKALESRCMTERMIQTSRNDIVPVLDDNYYHRERILRRMLLKFRLDYYDKIKYEYEDLGIPQLEPRLKQAVASFSVLLKNIPVLYDRFKEFVKNYNEKLIEDRADSYEGIITNALILLLEGENYFFTSRDIADKLTEEHGSDFKPASIGRVLKSMGFDNKQTKIEGKNKKIIKIYPNILKIICDRYLPVDHPLKKKVTEYMKKVTEVTAVTATTGYSQKNVTPSQSSIDLSGGGGYPVTAVTTDTSVTKKLEKWKKSQHSLEEKTPEFLEKTYNIKESEIQKLSSEGIIFSPHPGKYKIVN